MNIRQRSISTSSSFHRFNSESGESQSRRQHDFGNHSQSSMSLDSLGRSVQRAAAENERGDNKLDNECSIQLVTLFRYHYQKLKNNTKIAFCFFCTRILRTLKSIQYNRTKHWKISANLSFGQISNSLHLQRMLQFPNSCICPFQCGSLWHCHR